VSKDCRASPASEALWAAQNQWQQAGKSGRQILTSERSRVRVVRVNVEKTIEFILEQEARIDARLEKALERMDRVDKRMDRADKRAERAEKRLDRLERVVAQTNRVVTRLVRFGVSLRSDVRRHDKAILRIDAAVASLAQSQHRTDDRLNTLIKLVDRTIRRNGKF